MRRTLSLCTGLLVLCLLTGCAEQNADAARYYGTSSRVAKEAPMGPPVRIVIPRLKVDTVVDPVGQDADGNMDVPKSWDAAGWYEPGPKPGETGNAVIAGHFDSDTGPAIFWNLRALKKGDTIMVSDAAGKTRVFAITDIQEYDATDAPMEDIFGPFDGKRLNLITCTGSWSETRKGYANRLVVYSELVS